MAIMRNEPSVNGRSNCWATARGAVSQVLASTGVVKMTGLAFAVLLYLVDPKRP
jgi:hypothetical protein